MCKCIFAELLFSFVVFYNHDDENFFKEKKIDPEKIDRGSVVLKNIITKYGGLDAWEDIEECPKEEEYLNYIARKKKEEKEKKEEDRKKKEEEIKKEEQKKKKNPIAHLEESKNAVKENRVIPENIISNTFLKYVNSYYEKYTKGRKPMAYFFLNKYLSGFENNEVLFLFCSFIFILFKLIFLFFLT
jgi:hypothetical protein